MFNSTAPSPFGSLILLGILLYLVYRILQALNSQSRPAGGAGAPAGGGRVAPFPPAPVAPEVPPATARLVPYAGPDPFAGQPTALEAHAALIEKAGLERVGDFTIEEMPGYHVRVFTHPTQSLLGFIYRDPRDRVWVNLVTEYHDGRVITTSSAEEGATIASRPHGMPLFNYPGAAADQLIRRHKLEIRGSRQKPPTPPEGTPAFFSNIFTRLRAHVYEREQQEADRVRAPAASPGGPEEAQGDDAFVPSPFQQRQWLDAIFRAAPVPREGRAQFIKGLVWIRERASAESVARTIEDFAGITIDPAPGGRMVIRDDAGAQDIVDTAGLMGAALFERINDHLPESKKFARLPVKVEGVSFYSRTPAAR